MNRRRGFALLAVLWVVVLIGAISSSAVMHVRDVQGTAERHMGIIRGRWAAAACAAVVAERLEQRLRADNVLEPAAIDTIVLENGSRCSAEASDPGSLVNDTMTALVARLDSVLATRGDASRRATFITRSGDGRINVAAASAEVLLALPGMTEEAVRSIEELRRWSRMPGNLGALLASLPPGAREALANEYQDLLQLTTFGATAVVVTAVGWHSGGPAVELEQFVVHGGSRAAVVQQRIRW